MLTCSPSSYDYSEVLSKVTQNATIIELDSTTKCPPIAIEKSYIELIEFRSDFVGSNEQCDSGNVVVDGRATAGMITNVDIAKETERQDYTEDVEIVICAETAEKTGQEDSEFAPVQDDSINVDLANPEQEAKIEDCQAFEIKRHRGCDNRNMFVPTSDGKPKKLCCMFCLKRYQKLERHLRTVHKNEAEVKKFLAFPPRTKHRRDIIGRLRKKGEFMWNSDITLNGGELQTSRRPNKKFKRQPWQVIACANCMGTYSSNTLRHHWRKCTKNSIIGERVVKQLGRATEGRIHHTASDELSDMFSKFRDNEGIRMIQFDWLAVCYGEELCLNYSPYYQEGYIRSKLRAAGNVLRLSKAISSEISDLSSIFNVEHCNTVIEVIRQMGKFDRQSKYFGSPGTASTTVTLINTIGDLLITESMRLKDDEQEGNAERFLKVFKRDVKTKINKLVAVTIAKNRRGKKPNIPTTADVLKLSQFLDGERDAFFLELSEEYSYEAWFNLSQLLLVSIMVFNRRRAGEMRNIKISDFRDREIIANQSAMILETISQETKQEIKSRMQIRGKLDRTVPVLLKHSWEDCIDILIRHRKNAGLPENNEFLFALPTQSWRVRTINVWAAINSYAVACGAENPSSLKGTNLRKHLASYCATKKLNDRDVTNMADFMGHDERIHLKIYRQNPLSSQVSLLAPILKNAQGSSSNRTDHTKTVRAKPARVVYSSDDDPSDESDSCIDDVDESDSCQDDKDRDIVRSRNKNQGQKLSKPRKTDNIGASAMVVGPGKKKRKNQQQKIKKPRKTEAKKMTRKRKTSVTPKITKKIKVM